MTVESLVGLFIGALAAFINVIAGGGSAFSLGLMVELDMSPDVANATNRLLVAAQSIVGVWVLWKAGKLQWASALYLLPASLMGAAIGAWLAVALHPFYFELILALLFLVLGVHLLRSMRTMRRSSPASRAADTRRHRSNRGAQPTGESEDEDGWNTELPDVPSITSSQRTGGWRNPFLLHVFVMLTGIVGGFIQVGVGILMLLVLLKCTDLHLVEANAVKLVHAIAYSAVALVTFIPAGLVDFRFGLVLSIGGVIGAFAGVKMMLRVPETWLRLFLAALLFFVSLRMLLRLAAGA